MSTFRQSFGLGTAGLLNWFPRHMNTGLKQMQAKLRSVDCILEVHDARIPMSGRNPTFSYKLVGNKPLIVVLNKSDLISNDAMKNIRKIYDRTNNRNLVYTNSKNDRDTGIRKIVPLMKNLIETSDRFHRTGNKEYHAMIIGIPNVGKSSLINMLRSKHMRKGRALKVGPSAGVTKSVHEKVRICDDPQIFLFDTPGILTPRVCNVDVGIKLAVCGNLLDHQVGAINIADYILYKMNKLENYKYVEYLGLKEPSDCITTVLTHGALHLNVMHKIITIHMTYENKPDLNRVAEIFITQFRQGGFGRIVLDDIGSSARFDNSMEELNDSSSKIANLEEKHSNYNN